MNALARSAAMPRPFAYAVVGNAQDRLRVREAWTRLLAHDVDIIAWWTFSPPLLDGPPEGAAAFDDLLQQAQDRDVALAFPAAAGIGAGRPGVFSASGVVASGDSYTVGQMIDLGGNPYQCPAAHAELGWGVASSEMVTPGKVLMQHSEGGLSFTAGKFTAGVVQLRGALPGLNLFAIRRAIRRTCVPSVHVAPAIGGFGRHCFLMAWLAASGAVERAAGRLVGNAPSNWPSRTAPAWAASTARLSERCRPSVPVRWRPDGGCRHAMPRRRRWRSSAPGHRRSIFR